MATINTEVWGPLRDPGDWSTVMGPDVKLTQTVETTLSTGNDKHQPLDNSVCIFGFGTKSPAVNASVVTYNYNTNDYYNQKIFTDRSIIPWALANVSGPSYRCNQWESGYPAYSYVYGNNYRWVTTCPTEGGPDQESELGNLVKPMWFYSNGFDYQKKWIVLVKPVCLSKHTVDNVEYKEGATSSITTLKDWYDNVKNKYQGITEIYLAPTTYNQSLPSNSGGMSFALFEHISEELNIEYAEGDPHKDQQKIDGNFYAYRTNTGPYTQVDGNYLNGYLTIAGGHTIDSGGDWTYNRWNLMYTPQVGDWDIHMVKPVSSGGTGDGWGFFLGYNPGAKTYNTVLDEIAQIAAHMGTFFVFDWADINKENDDYNVFLGLLDAYAVSTGEYSRGEDNKDSDQFDWGTAADADFNPADMGDKLIPDNNGSELRVPLYAMIGGYSYIMSGGKFVDIWDKMNDNFTERYNDLKDTLDLWKTTYDNDQDDPLLETISKRISWSVTSLKDMFTGSVAGLGQDPNTAIKSILCFPFDLTPYISYSDHYFKWGFNIIQDANIGLVHRINGLKSQFWIPGGSVNTTLGSGTYVPYTNSFLDYAPYTTSQLYIPYCGCVDIDPAIYVGKTLTVRYLVDYITGACTALIYAGNEYGKGDIIDQISGNMAVSISLSSLDTSNYMNAIWQGNQSFKVAKGGVLGATANAIETIGKDAFDSFSLKDTVGAGVGIANAMVNLQNANYQLATAPVNFKQIMYGSSFIATGADQRVRLYNYRPMTLGGSPVSKDTSWGDYAHTTGFACIMNTTINASGLSDNKYLQGNIDTSGIQATETEKEMIRSLLSSGVYV